MGDWLWLIIVLPLLGAVFLHFGGKRIGEPVAGWIAAVLMGGSFLVSLIAALPHIGGETETTRVVWWDWMPAIGASLEVQWDALSALMALVVTGVGTLIHIYSIGYMHGDPRFARFFTYLNLFAASMLILVLASNFAMLFLGWEAVGLCSYLLISFWYDRDSAASAGKKAFVVNRIGDFGFMVALMLIFASFGTLSYVGVLERVPETLNTTTATAIGLLLLVGAAGKSAQLPLYVWLPDAMEGPTPVSALIHAATMVTAGVYLIARTAPIYAEAPFAAGVVATIGALTALIAATIALAQNDIKRVLAYSTISQLGYMFLAVGAAAYVAGVFHLLTHAFFKALLFLGAGSVIHALSDEQDMRKMGGLAKRMPITAITMGIATVAIAGIPPLAGFWSKDEILASVAAAGGWWIILYAIGLVTAVLTAFYMTRLFMLTFGGRPRWDPNLNPHESPLTMTIPLLVLAGLSVVAGLINTPMLTGLEHFLDPVFTGIKLGHPPDSGWSVFFLAVISVVAAGSGMVVAWFTYRELPTVWKKFQAVFGRWWGWWEQGYRIDDLYSTALVGPGYRLALMAAFRFDLGWIDGGVDGVAGLVRDGGQWMRRLQSGYVRVYSLLLMIGAVLVVVWLLAVGGALF